MFERTGAAVPRARTDQRERVPHDRHVRSPVSRVAQRSNAPPAQLHARRTALRPTQSGVQQVFESLEISLIMSTLSVKKT